MRGGGGLGEEVWCGREEEEGGGQGRASMRGDVCVSSATAPTRVTHSVFRRTPLSPTIPHAASCLTGFGEDNPFPNTPSTPNIYRRRPSPCCSITPRPLPYSSSLTSNAFACAPLVYR